VADQDRTVVDQDSAASAAQGSERSAVAELTLPRLIEDLAYLTETYLQPSLLNLSFARRPTPTPPLRPLVARRQLQIALSPPDSHPSPPLRPIVARRQPQIALSFALPLLPRSSALIR